MSDFRSEFDDDDDFNIDDNNDFDFPEDEAGFDFGGDDAQEDFDFGEDDEEFTFDEGGIDLGDEGPDIEVESDDGGGGTNRTFVIIAALMILLFVGGLVAVVLLGTNRPLSDFELSSTAIRLTNDAVQVALNASETASFNLGGTQTAEANFTPTPSPAPTNTRPPTITPTPPPDLTEVAAQQLTVQAEALTQQALTEAAASPTGLDIADVQLTATALAAMLGQGGGASPTAEVPTTPGTPAAPRPTALPDTGLFDDLAASSGSTGMLVFMAFGLVAVIFVSRRLRAANNRS